MSVKLSPEQDNLIEEIVSCKGFNEYNMKIASGSMKGDGYLGIISTVDVQDAKKPSKQLHLIVKAALTEDKLRENSPVKKAYEREIYMYKTIFPEFRVFSDEVGIKNKFTETAKCYGSLLSDKQECIILENLRENGFKLWNRKLPMNEEHVALVFTTYAKFHGTGLAFKFLRPKEFEEMSKNMKHIFSKDVETEADKKKFIESFKAILGNGFRAVANNEAATQTLTRFAENSGKFFTEDLKKIDRYCTIVHGDCWCNNMMFKYADLKDPAKPTEMCLLDWQLGQIGSPILDLSYFFYACSSRNVLYDLEKFLKIYHDQLKEIVKEAGLNPNNILTYEELLDQWKFYSKYGLFMSLLVMKVALGEVEEAPDLSEMAKSGKNILESIIDGDSTNMEAINKRIADIIIFMMEHDYL